MFSIKTAKLKKAPYKIFDGGGLHVVLNPRGSKLWRLKYCFQGKERLAVQDGKENIGAGKRPAAEMFEPRFSVDNDGFPWFCDQGFRTLWSTAFSSQ